MGWSLSVASLCRYRFIFSFASLSFTLSLSWSFRSSFSLCDISDSFFSFSSSNFEACELINSVFDHLKVLSCKIRWSKNDQTCLVKFYMFVIIVTYILLVLYTTFNKIPFCYLVTKKLLLFMKIYNLGTSTKNPYCTTNLIKNAVGKVFRNAQNLF